MIHLHNSTALSSPLGDLLLAHYEYSVKPLDKVNQNDVLGIPDAVSINLRDRRYSGALSSRFEQCKILLKDQEDAFKINYALKMLGYTNSNGRTDGEMYIPQHSLYIGGNYTGFMQGADSNDYFKNSSKKEITLEDISKEFVRIYGSTENNLDEYLTL